MTTPYFSKFPKVTSNNQVLTNIMHRAKIDDTVLTDTSAFLQYNLQFEQTIETLGYDYYGDTGYFWLVALANDIVDPYYDWYIKDDVLDEIVESQYGSIANAQSTFLYYERLPTSNTDPYINIVVTPATYLSGNTVGVYDAIDAYTQAQNENLAKMNVNLVAQPLATAFDSALTAILSS